MTDLRRQLVELRDARAVAQEALRESEIAHGELNEKTRALQVLLDAFPCVALILRPRTREIVAGNKAAEKVGAIPGTRCFSTWGQRSDPCPWCLAPDAWATGEPQHREVEGLGVVWDAHWIPVGPDLYMHYAFDITERRRKENILRETQQRLDLALQAADLGLWDWYVQSGQAIVNERAAKIVGYSLDEIETTFNFWESLLHPDDKDRVLERLVSYLSGPAGLYEDEYRARSRSGEWKWVLSRGKVVEHDSQGSPTRMIGTYLDITERKQAEERLRLSEERYRTVADFTYDWEYWADPSGKFLYVSPSCERITGYTAQEFLDNPGLMRKIIHPDDLAQAVNHYHQVMNVDQTGTYSLDFRIIRRNGDVRWINHVCQPVQERSGPPLGRRACNRDITDRKLAEQEMLESEARYRALFQNMRNGVAIYSSIHNGEDFVFVDLNRAAENICGLRRDQVGGKSVRELFPGVQNLGLFDALQQTWRTGAPAHVPVSKYQDERMEIWVENFVYKLPSGEIVAVFGDETQRKEAEEALRRSEAKYRAIFDNAAIGIDLVDREGRFREVNPTFAHMLGYTQHELQALSTLDVTHPEDREASAENLNHLVRRDCHSYRLEKRYIRKDGTVLWADLSVSAILNALGEHEAIIGVITDITKRKRSELAQRRLATAVEQVQEAVVITDPLGTIEYVNPAFERMTGYTREEAIGEKPSLLKDLDDDPELFETLKQTLGPGNTWAGRLEKKRKDGTPYFEDVTISPVKDSSGNIINYVAIKRDISQEIALQQQLLQAQKMEAVGTLAGGIAHDFNNLLQVTLGYSEMLLMDREESDPEYADLQKIFRASRSGSDLVRRLLTFSRKVEPKMRPMNLNQQVRHAEKILMRTIPKMIDIELNLTEPLPAVNADPTQIEQVIMNLAVNARDAMPDGGKLLVATRTETVDDHPYGTGGGSGQGRSVILEVSDTGHGMDDETLQHVFEPFYTTKELGRGTGLGLAMVYGIVELHGGRITCESAPGKGTSFRIFLPAFESADKFDFEEDVSMSASGTETILLVDDEELVRELGRRILSRNGYTVLTATNGKEALASYDIGKDAISLVLLDLVMPEMGGSQCLSELMKINPHLKVIVASGYMADPSVHTALEAGARGFVGKPFRATELLQKVRQTLDSG